MIEAASLEIVCQHNDPSLLFHAPGSTAGKFGGTVLTRAAVLLTSLRDVLTADVRSMQLPAMHVPGGHKVADWSSSSLHVVFAQSFLLTCCTCSRRLRGLCAGHADSFLHSSYNILTRTSQWSGGAGEETWVPAALDMQLY